MDDQRFPTISSVGVVCLTGRGIYRKREYVKDGPTAELPARTGRYLSLLPT
jgi:hypothetical protein